MMQPAAKKAAHDGHLSYTAIGILCLPWPAHTLNTNKYTNMTTTNGILYYTTTSHEITNSFHSIHMLALMTTLTYHLYRFPDSSAYPQCKARRVMAVGKRKFSVILIQHWEAWSILATPVAAIRPFLHQLFPGPSTSNIA